MSAITNTQKAKMNKMNRIAQDTGLGTIVQNLQNAAPLDYANHETRIGVLEAFGFAKGKHTVSSDEGTAGTLTINTGVTVGGFIVQIYRAGKLVTGQAVSAATTNITVATNGSTYVLTAGDVINYIVFA